MSPENKITEIPASYTVEEIDKHMQEMNDEGFDLVYVQERPNLADRYGVATNYRIFWKRVQWKM